MISDMDTKCKMCDRRLVSEANMRRHVLKYHPDSALAAGLKHHPDNACAPLPDAHQPNDRQTIKRCQHCGQEFRSNSNLSQHLFNKHPQHMTTTGPGDKPPEPLVQCKVRDKVFKQTSSLSQHMIRKHPGYCQPQQLQREQQQQLQQRETVFTDVNDMRLDNNAHYLTTREDLRHPTTRVDLLDSSQYVTTQAGPVTMELPAGLNTNMMDQIYYEYMVVDQ